MKHILFSYLKIPACSVEGIVQALKNVPEHHWFYDSYRTVNMLSIFTDNGDVTKQGVI